ncbi:unnamed protein product [Lathyrus sativus]|nr:unnamed protein product [Lathyrus sativus]
MSIINQKLKLHKAGLKYLNNLTFGNLHNSVSKDSSILDDIQININNSGPTDELLEQEKVAKTELDLVLSFEEAFWKEKANSNWHSNGNQNNDYFHKLTKIKHAYKSIYVLKDTDYIIIDPSLITKHVVDHIRNLFSSYNYVQDNNLIEETIPSLISDQMNLIKSQIPSHEEISYIVFP